MDITSANPRWGSIVEGITIDDIYKHADKWRDLLYERKLLIIRGLPRVMHGEMWWLQSQFGKPWTKEEYMESLEGVVSDSTGKCLTVYGNQTARKAIGDKAMPWHRDIPWHRNRRYPIRSLYPVLLDNTSNVNTTRFCDADYLWHSFPKEEHEKIGKIKITIQNWYQMVKGNPKPDLMTIPLVEKHPKTQRWSVLLNSFGYDKPEFSFATARSGTWIVDASIDGASIGLQLIQKFHELVCVKENIYEHEWKRGDLVLFDNFSGVFHNRGALVPEDSSKKMHREFWRMNLKHPFQE